MRRRVLFLVVLILFALIGWEVYIRVRWAPERIAHELLAETPLGTDRDEVKNWNLAKGRHRVGGLNEPDDALGFDVGGYQSLLFRERLWAFWIFDQEDKLTDIHVHTWWLDAP